MALTPEEQERIRRETAEEMKRIEAQAEAAGAAEMARQKAVRAGTKTTPVKEPEQPTVGTKVGQETMSAIEARKKQLEESKKY